MRSYDAAPEDGRTPSVLWTVKLALMEGWGEGEGCARATQDLRVRFDARRTLGALWL